MAKVNFITATLITYDEQNNTKNTKGKHYADQNITFKLADDTSVTGEGRLITPKACHQMVKENFQINRQNPASDFNGYRVGKEAILQIIGQKNCEGILVLNCLNDLGKNSLVFAGVDSQGKLLKSTSFSKSEIKGSQTTATDEGSADIPIIIERIGIVSTKGIIEEMETVDPPLQEDDKLNKMADRFLFI
jgi:hypothetical protein